MQIDIPSSSKKGLNKLNVALMRCEHHWSEPFRILQVYIGSGGNQRLSDFDVAQTHGNVERGNRICTSARLRGRPSLKELPNGCHIARLYSCDQLLVN